MDRTEWQYAWESDVEILSPTQEWIPLQPNQIAPYGVDRFCEMWERQLRYAWPREAHSRKTVQAILADSSTAVGRLPAPLRDLTLAFLFKPLSHLF